MKKRNAKTTLSDFDIDQSYLQFDFTKDFSIIDFRGVLANALEPLFDDSYILEFLQDGLLYTNQIGRASCRERV